MFIFLFESTQWVTFMPYSKNLATPRSSWQKLKLAPKQSPRFNPKGSVNYLKCAALILTCKVMLLVPPLVSAFKTILAEKRKRKQKLYLYELKFLAGENRRLDNGFD